MVERDFEAPSYDRMPTERGTDVHATSDQIKLEITFTSGETITYRPEQWDDYAYDGKAVIVKLRGAWVGIYNFDSVFCVELKPV